MCQDLVVYLKGDKCVLEFNAETFPNKSVINEDNSLDMAKLLMEFSQIMNELCLEIQPLDDNELARHIEQYTEHSTQLQALSVKFDEVLSTLNDFKSGLCGTKVNNNETSESDLAQPLPVTPSHD